MTVHLFVTRPGGLEATFFGVLQDGGEPKDVENPDELEQNMDNAPFCAMATSISMVYFFFLGIRNFQPE